ncbi:MAG: hypothetical protein ACUZ8N_05585 [Candidatus Scalindua sp.]
MIAGYLKFSPVAFLISLLSEEFEFNVGSYPFITIYFASRNAMDIEGFGQAVERESGSSDFWIPVPTG